MQQDWITHLTRVTSEYPDHADEWCSLGQALHMAGRLDEALDALDRALRVNPNYADAQIERAFVLGDAGRVGDAYSQLRNLFGMAPDTLSVVFAIGVFAMRHGFVDTGIAQLRRAGTLAPRSAYVREFLATALEQFGDDVGATEQRARAAELASRFLPVVEQADSFRRAVGQDFRCTWPAPSLARAHAECAFFLLRAGEQDAAHQELRLANTRFPGHSKVMVRTGRLLNLLDRPAEAMRWLEAAIAVDDACHQAHVELSFLHARADRMVQAAHHARAAVELRPMFPDYRYQFGTLLSDLGRTVAATHELEQALLLRPADGHAAIQLAAAYAAQERHEEALSVLAATDCRDWIEAQLISAEVLVKGGRGGEARAMLERILTADPEQPEARELLAKLPG